MGGSPPVTGTPSLGRALTDGVLRALPAADRDPAHDALAGAGRRIDALLEAMLIVSSGLDEEVTLRQIVQVATDLTRSAYGALGVVDRRGHTDAFVQVGIDGATAARIGSPPTGRGLLGVPIEQDRPIRLTDLSRHPASAGFPPHHPIMRTLLAVPIRARGRPSAGSTCPASRARNRSPPTTRSSSRPWPPRPGSPSTTRACTPRRGTGRPGSRPSRRSRPSCWAAPTRLPRCG